ncbi:hypothetical protein PISMIDRAFT_257797 [Pisolithus microcarpus 441]|uniref:Uncharacterized protein n=1 Tax=Pisolithus microcarpus 441 TaxID=765257 RepID=A0A0C9ZW94_9AGAM|nr:hypothetical protein PISMIDRAFT_257797 [Pisolithus microcarpus 441]
MRRLMIKRDLPWKRGRPVDKIERSVQPCTGLCKLFQFADPGCHFLQQRIVHITLCSIYLFLVGSRSSGFWCVEQLHTYHHQDYAVMKPRAERTNIKAWAFTIHCVRA